MGCTKSSQKELLENNKETEIVYEPNQHKPNYLRKQITKNGITGSLISKIVSESQTSKNELPLVEKEKLVELTDALRSDKKKMRLLKKCQSHILGMQFRKKIRIDNLKKSEEINLDLLYEKNINLPKDEIVKFFENYPPINDNDNIIIEKKDPLILENNIIYYGEWDINFFTKHGRGIQMWPDGSYYKGYWENNKAEGKGEFKHFSGDIYIGNWHNNKRHGKGVYHSKKGMEYNGHWVNDKQEGKGKEVWEDGSTYEGYYLKGFKNGKGEMKWANGCVYKGNFENGIITGKGIYTFSDGRIYKGDFNNNNFEGKGVFTWPNGNKYSGYFKSDKREGFGVLKFFDGRKYRGIWKNGKQIGEFDVFIPSKGIWIKKKWKEDEDNKNNKDNEKENNNNKILLDEEQRIERNRMVEDEDLEKIEQIEKTEENKIDELYEDI